MYFDYITLHTVQKKASVHWFCVSRKDGTGEVGRVTRWVLCTWQLLGLTVKGLWLAPGGPILTLAISTGIENATLTLQGVHFWQERLLGL